MSAEGAVCLIIALAVVVTILWALIGEGPDDLP